MAKGLDRNQSYSVKFIVVFPKNISSEWPHTKMDVLYNTSTHSATTNEIETFYNIYHTRFIRCNRKKKNVTLYSFTKYMRTIFKILTIINSWIRLFSHVLVFEWAKANEQTNVYSRCQRQTLRKLVILYEIVIELR